MKYIFYILFFISVNLIGQTFKYSYIDPCSGALKSVEVPKEGVTINYFNQMKNAFTSGNFLGAAQIKQSAQASQADFAAQVQQQKQQDALANIIINGFKQLEINVNGKTGFLNAVGDFEAMANNAFFILENDERLKEFKRNVFEQAKTFSIENIFIFNFKNI